MKIRLIATGGRMPDWVSQALRDYRARLPRHWQFDILELPLAVRGKAQDPRRAMAAEAERVLRALAPAERLIALDERGRSWDSLQLSTQLAAWQQDGRDLSLVIGGPDGHADSVLARAEQRWSLSPLTLPHAMVRIIVVEQLYRAHSLLSGHPYHRGDPGNH